MLELPEANVIAQQVNKSLQGKRISNVNANCSPHKFAWFYGEPRNYYQLLAEKVIEKAIPCGGMIEISAGDARILLGDGVGLRYYGAGEELPVKHQLQIEFDDLSSLVGSVQMYGGLWAFPEGQFDNPYYQAGKQKISPLSEQFDFDYFGSLLEDGKPKLKSLSAKAFLATEQRIPGLGNGVLQDILWAARIHPKRKMATLSEEELHHMFKALKTVLAEMTANGGRDTERDLYGCPGGYKTIASKNTVDKPCPTCGTLIKKEAFLGGSIYYCGGCQRL
ncbi:MAG TPA: endonuclease VIII [Firmicutes bacterium]|jgi:formamidopyrimidine-DNA glycosylase|nr:endonuclease VIII [Bacillota bacterium]